MSRPLFRASMVFAALAAPAVWAAEPAKPTKPTVPVAKPAAPAARPATPAAVTEGAKVVVTAPVTVGSLPPVDPLAPPAPPPTAAQPLVPIALTKNGLTVILVVGTDAEKTWLVAHVPTGVALDFQRKYVMSLGWALAGQRSPTFAFTGRLTTENEQDLFPDGVAPILNNVPAFSLGGKRLVLVVDSVSELNRFNRDKFPSEGYVSVEGTPAAKGSDVLTVLNGKVPVTVVNRKPEAAATVRATGTLVAIDGTVKLQDAVVKVVKK